MSAPKKTNAAAVQKIPSTTSATIASRRGHRGGRIDGGERREARRAAITRLAPMAARGSRSASVRLKTIGPAA